MFRLNDNFNKPIDKLEAVNRLKVVNRNPVIIHSSIESDELMQILDLCL